MTSGPSIKIHIVVLQHLSQSLLLCCSVHAVVATSLACIVVFWLPIWPNHLSLHTRLRARILVMPYLLLPFVFHYAPGPSSDIYSLPNTMSFEV